MLAILIFCVSIGLVSSQAHTANTCGRRPLVPSGDEDYDRIVGGVESLAGDWPWSCSMRYKGQHICGGSLINRKWIVTAGHCVSVTASPSFYTWACGIHSRTQSQTAQLTNEVLPVCFPPATATYANDISIALGWGSIVSGGGSSSAHREVSMPVLPDATCEARFDSTNDMLDPTTQVCAGVEGGNKDTCQGDSGGSLVVKMANGFWYIIGLTSWGYGCGDGGVYTRSSAFRAWVESYTGPLPTGTN